MPHRFTRTSFFIWGVLLVWAADFLFLYVFAAIACARGLLPGEAAGFAILPSVGVLASGIAILATALLMRTALRRIRKSAASDSVARFIDFLVLALGALALIAIVWTALPPLLLRQDCPAAAAIGG